MTEEQQRARSRQLWLRGFAFGTFYVVALAYYAWLLWSNSQRIHEPRIFGDTDTYLSIARLPVLSAAFWTGIKPGVVPFFYKLVGVEPDRIVVLQLWFSIACWGILALAAAHAVRSTWLKPLAFAIVLAFTLSRDVFMWIPFLGSEAISFGLMAIFIAAALWLITDWKAYKLPVLIAAGFLMAFSRDTAAFILLAAAVVMVPLLWLSTHRRHLMIIIAAFMAIFAVSSITGRLGMRPDIVFHLFMALRVFPNEEYLAYFKNLGMPADPVLVERSNPNLPEWRKWYVYVMLSYDPSQSDYRQWVRQNGSTSYARFLWFYKADTLQRMFIEDGGSSVFYPNVYYYTATGYRPILKDPRLAEILYPTRFGIVYFFAAQMIAALAVGFALMLRKGSWFVPLSMILLTYPQAFLVWNADPNDIPRHSIGHNIMERLGLWLLLLFVLDLAYQSLKPALMRLRDRVRALRAAAPVKD